MSANPVTLFPSLPPEADRGFERRPANRSTVRLRDYLQRQSAQSLAQLKRALADSSSAASTEERGPVRLGELVVVEGLASPGEVTRALELQRAQPSRRLGELLVAEGVLDAQAVRHLLAQHLGIPAVDLARFPIDPGASSLVPEAVCRRCRILPLCIVDATLVVALVEPADKAARDAARFTAKRPVQFVIATATDLAAALDRCFGSDSDLDTAVMAAASVQDSDGDPEAPVDLTADVAGEERPVIRLVNSIIKQAVHRRASDVHIRPTARGVQLSLRIDGMMVPLRTLSRQLLAPVVARIKVMTRMDFSQRFLPQDGSARVVDGERMVDLRVSVIPTVNGESVVIRILDAEVALKSLDQVGFDADDTRVLRNMLSRSSGMVLVTGPTGSGKTTTLYAALREVLARQITVMSVENPVEYHIDGMDQISVHHDIGLTFAKALRHILRHDPDAIMVGEIRDAETAEVSLEAAMTGHLVLSTLHTNSATAAIPRLIDMGVAPYLIASTISGVVAQRLVRINCSECLASEEVSDEMRVTLGVGPHERFARGFGCDRCSGTGYLGREVMYELMPMTPALRSAIQDQAGGEELQRLALEGGMVPLPSRVLAMARERRTSLAEAFRIRIS